MYANVVGAQTKRLHSAIDDGSNTITIFITKTKTKTKLMERAIFTSSSPSFLSPLTRSLSCSLFFFSSFLSSLILICMHRLWCDCIVSMYKLIHNSKLNFITMAQDIMYHDVRMVWVKENAASGEQNEGNMWKSCSQATQSAIACSHFVRLLILN